MKPFQHPPKLPAESKTRCAAILWNLHLQGPVEDPDGAAVETLMRRLADVGWAMPKVTVGRIVDGLGNRGGRHSDMYPYHYIDREVGGKRTFSIRLIVDPEKVPFPPNPFKNWPAFHQVPTKGGKSKRGPKEAFADPGPALDPPEEGETFARQRQFESVVAAAEPVPVPPVAPEEVEPDPELVETPDDTITDLDPIELDPVGSLEPYRAEAEVRTNGADNAPHDDEFDLGDLPADLLADLGEDRPRTAMDMVSAAISLLSDAMAAHAGEQMHLATDVLDRHIDTRLGEYRVLLDRVDATEGKLRHTVAQYEKVVTIARAQRKQLVALQRELARLRSKSSTSA